MISYLLTLTLVWGAGLALYFLLLRRLPHHRFNRAYLLVTLLTGLALPLMPKWSAEIANVSALPALPEFWLPMVTVGTEGVAQASSSDSGSLLISLGYMAAFAFLLAALWRLLRLHMQSRFVEELRGMHIREVAGKQAPASFGRMIYTSNWSELSAHDQDTVALHERAHFDHGHSLDVLLLTVATAVFWFHPLVYLLRRELRLIHEFQADAAVLREVQLSTYRVTLLSHQFGTNASTFAAAFNHSPLNLRLMMMSSALRQNQWWRLATAALCLAFVAIACQKEEITEHDLDEVARLNSDTRTVTFPEEEVQKGNFILTSVDTLILIDHETHQQNWEIIRYYADKDDPTDVLVERIDALGQRHLQIRNENVYGVADEMPHFPSNNCTEGDSRCFQRALLEHVYKTIGYPQAARDAGIEGTAVISFIVGKDGELLQPMLRRAPGEADPAIAAAFEEELLNLVNTMPAWVPGKKDGEIVQVKFALPVKFKL